MIFEIRNRYIGEKSLDPTKIDINEYLFLVAWSIYSVSAILDFSILVYQNRMFPLMFQIMRYASYAICLVCIYYKVFNEKEIIFVAAVVGAFLISYIGSHSKFMSLSVLLFVAAVNISSEKIIRASVIIQGTVLMFFTLFSNVGIIMDYVFTPEGRIRHCLGFMYPTYAPIMFFHCALGVLYLSRARMKIWMLVVLELINIYYFKMTDTTMAFYCLTVIIVIILLFRAFDRNGRLATKGTYFFLLYPFLMMIISLFLVVRYDEKDEWWRSFDGVVHSRIHLGRDALYQYGVNLFGHDIEWKGIDVNTPVNSEQYNYVDSSFIQLLINFGLLFIIAILLIYAAIIYKAICVYDYTLVLVCVAVLTLSLSEPRLMHLAFNPIPLLVFSKIDRPYPVYETNT